jgi:hypothetical protein
MANLAPYIFDEQTLMYVARCSVCGYFAGFYTLEVVKQYDLKVPMFATHECDH